MDTVISIQVRGVRLPMIEAHRTASGEITESPLVLVDVTTADGSVGHGLVFTYTVAALNPLMQLLQNMGPLLVGQPLAPASVMEQLHKKFRLLGTQGLVGIALAAIDMALWDAKVRAAGMSLVSYLGGVAKPIPVYAGIGYEGVDGSAQAAERLVGEGFLGVKAKIGYPTLEQDVAVVGAIRAAVGDEVAVMVDYNQCLMPVEAIQRIKALSQFRLSWVEEPTLAHDFQGHRRIADAVDTPIQCGENWWGPLDMQHAIDAQSSDYMMADVMKIGGVSGWMQASALAAQRGIRLSSHLWPELSAQLLCLTPTAHWLEYIDWWNPIIAEPLQVENGYARVDVAEATGVRWNESVVARYQV
ncbi:MAG: enolase C-terminal domain-like protein [Motiliproteus sp.]